MLLKSQKWNLKAQKCFLKAQKCLLKAQKIFFDGRFWHKKSHVGTPAKPYCAKCFALGGKSLDTTGKIGRAGGWLVKIYKNICIFHDNLRVRGKV